MTDDNAKIISAAIKLLTEKKVDENLMFLIDLYRSDNNYISINLRSYVEAVQREQLNIQSYDKCIDFSFEGNVLKIVIGNMRFSSLPDDSGGQYGDIYLIYNGECVLQNSINEDFNDWGSSYSIAFYESSIKQLKAGIWLDKLNLVVEKIKSHEEERERAEKAEKLKSTASKIDLGDFKL